MRLLVVEDDRDLNRQIASALEAAGYVVDRAFDGEEGWFLGDTEPYDAIVLDIGLPKRDGVKVLEQWREAGRKTPVLILTARDRWSDKVQGFDAGADDYVAKPFHMEEVLARVRALLRRAAGHATSDLVCGPIKLETRSGRVIVDGAAVKLTSHEYRLLSYLMHHVGRVISRTELVEHLYDQDFDRDSNTIEVFVGRLRKKLGVDMIQTVRGLGYIIAAPEPSRSAQSACPVIVGRRRQASSIATRLFVSATFWSILLLLVAGVILAALYRRNAEQAFDQRLGVYLKAIVADVATAGDDSNVEPGQLGEPQFELSLSGWYWQITRLDSQTPVIKASRSLFASALPRLSDLGVQGGVGGARRGTTTGPDGRPIRIVERTIDLGDSGVYLVQVAATTEEVEDQIWQFELALVATFAFFAVALAGATALQVRYGLRPLRELRQEVAQHPARRQRARRRRVSRTISRCSQARSTCSSPPIARSSRGRARRSAISPMR